MVIELPGERIELAAAPEPRPLVPAAGVDPVAVAGLAVADAGTVADVLERHAMRGLVVLRDGELAYEWYRPGSDRHARRPCFSVTKSFTGTLVATAVHDGRLDRAARIGDVVPELADSGFATATVGDAADMTVSLAYDETYTDADLGAGDGDAFGFNDYMHSLTPEAPGSLRGLLARIGPGSGPHGEVFAYATPVSDVLGWVLERATGRAYPDLLHEQLWRHVGAEASAHLGITSDGTPLAGGGLAMTTRDLARFGQLVLERRHVDRTVVASMRVGDPTPFERGSYAYLEGYAYRDQWWLPTGGSSEPGPLSAWGIHGQFLWVDLDRGVVVAGHAAGPDASDLQRDLDQDQLCRAIVDAVATR